MACHKHLIAVMVMAHDSAASAAADRPQEVAPGQPTSDDDGAGTAAADPVRDPLAAAENAAALPRCNARGTPDLSSLASPTGGARDGAVGGDAHARGQGSAQDATLAEYAAFAARKLLFLHGRQGRHATCRHSTLKQQVWL